MPVGLDALTPHKGNLAVTTKQENQVGARANCTVMGSPRALVFLREFRYRQRDAD